MPILVGAWRKLRFTRRQTIFVAAALLITAGNTPAQEKALLWKAESGNNSIYLLGSIHFLRKENYPLHKTIIDAFDKSKRLIIEIDLNNVNQEAVKRATLDKAIYRDGTTLAENVSRETYAMTRQRTAELGLDVQFINSFKPWFASLTLMTLKLQKLGLDPEHGVDRHLANRAKKDGKTTRGLETLEFQIGLLDQLPAREQESMLKETVEEMERLDKNFELIVGAWLKGDAAGLESLLLSGLKAYPEVHDKILVERNRRWVPQIEKMLEEGDGAMVVVGAAHLVGKDGVVEMLKARGYKLEQQ